MASKEFHIIGAGLVGSLWAYILKKKGWTVHVYEKRSDPRLPSPAGLGGGRSINLIITSRGLNGLKKAGLADSVLPITIPIFGRRIHNKNGVTAYQAYGRDDSECNYAVSRGDLNKELIEQAQKIGVNFYFSHELKEIEVNKKKLHFADNKIVTYDCVFATDGAGSVVRKNLATLAPQIYKENISYISSDYKELYLPPSLDQKPQLEKNNLHIWPRGTHMLMALANPDHSFTLTLYLPKTNDSKINQSPIPWSFDTIQTKHHVRELFTSEFNDIIDLIPDLEPRFLENIQGNLGTVRFSKWHFENSLALMGDAAHAIVPFFGQGMNSGFEDVTALLDILDQNQWNLRTSFEKYSTSRIPNTQAIADMALENFVEMSAKVGDQEFLLQKKIESLLEKEFPDLYRSRYGMITYTLIPYKRAQEAGLIQNRLLSELAKDCRQIEDLDLNHCRKLMDTEWLPWLRNHGINLDRFVV